MVKRLLTQNGLAVLTVILYHASAYGFIAMFWWTDRYQVVSVPNFAQMGSLSYYALRAVEQVVIFGIPSFMFVSGYFIAVATKRDQKTIDWQIVLSRIKVLVIPFLIWSSVILVFHWLQGERYGAGELLITIITGRTTDAYYYVPLLVQLLIISPFIVPLARQYPRWLLLIGIVIQVVMLSYRYLIILDIKIPSLEPLELIDRSWFITKYFFWFSLGILFGFHLQEYLPVLKRLRWVWVGLTVFFFIVGMIEWEVLLKLSGQSWIGPRETFIDQLYALAFIFSLLSFNAINPSIASCLSNLGVKSYGIYLIHALVLEISAKVIYHILPGLLAYQVLFQPVLIGLALGIPLALMAVVDKSPFRRYYKYLFG